MEININKHVEMVIVYVIISKISSFKFFTNISKDYERKKEQ